MSQRLLFGILLLALGLRLALWAQPLHEPANDEVEYIAVASDLLAGRGWAFYEHYHWLRAPLYPLFLAASLWLAGGNLHLAALPNLLLSVGVVWLVALLTRELVAGAADTRPDRAAPYTRAPLLAALAAALLWTQATFASLYMSETLFAFLLAAALVLLLRWRRRVRAGGGGGALLLLAGVCYGLATLTRSLPLAFVPVVVVWVAAVAGGTTGRWWQRARPALLAGGLFVAAVVLTIAPWTLRNCQAYGRCIVVETGLSYNLWAFNEPREGMTTIFRTLEQIPNPAERADEATRRGLERLQEDPAILLRKLRPNWVYLWRIKPIQDRFLLPTYYADPPPLVFLAALLLDDALYVALLLLAVVGASWRVALPAAPRSPPRVARWLLGALRSPDALLVLWVLYVISSTLLTHGEARYRHFFFPVLIAYAAIGGLHLARAVRQRRTNRQAVPLWAGRGVVALLLLATVASAYPWQWAARGAVRSAHRLMGDVAVALGNDTAAEVAYRRALAADDTADVAIALGNLYLRQDQPDAARAAYLDAWEEERHYIAASARYADMLRRQGELEEARRAFVGFYVSEQQVLDWSWAHLEPPPTTRIQVGDGLDFGYVGGMYQDEAQQGAHARWTDGRGLLRLAAPLAGRRPAVLRLRLAAPRPNADHIEAQVCIRGHCQPVPLMPTWREVALLVPPDPYHQHMVVELRSPTFQAPDGRSLGVLVDWAAVELPGASRADAP